MAYCTTDRPVCVKYIRIKQDGNEFELDCDEADWNNIWKSYLDMDTDYAGIAKLIADGDDAHLKEAYAYGSGVRILRQDLWEMIVTFMISQNNNIKRITNSVDLLCNPRIIRIHIQITFPYKIGRAHV